MSADLELALELADLADQLSMPRFRAHDLVVETKPDLTPVSEADKAVEQAIRQRLAEVRPDHTVLGEEFGTAEVGPSGCRWVLDPIDGTINFVRGIPVWATLIGLERDGRIDVGVVSAPALGRRWWAERGGGAFADGQAIRVSKVAQLEHASLSFAGPGLFADRGQGPALTALTQRADRSRGYGDFWQHCLVAEGAVDAAFEPIVAYYDIAALVVVVEEAGGVFSDVAGRPWAEGAGALSTNGLLHEAVVEAMAAPGAELWPQPK